MYISATTLILMISAYMVIVYPKSFFKIVWIFIKTGLAIFGLIIAPLFSISAYFHYNKSLNMTYAIIGIICLIIALYSWNKFISFFKQEAKND
jgi:peptidoglycan/LPS O-acetylase OafA/YrhL